MSIVTIARWQLATEHRAAVLQHIVELRERSLEEPGCEGYELLQPLSEPNVLVLLERYKDDAALAAHRGTPHYRTLVTEQILPRLLARKVEVLRP